MHTRFLSGEEVWSTLAKLSTKAKRQRTVATGYLGDGAGKLLGLRKGDRLITALTKANAKCGSVSPKEVRRLQREEVEVFVVENLHAKVYLLGDALAVGSPNLSLHSRDHLLETLIVTTHRATVASARKWLTTICTLPATPELVEQCLSVYRPPRRIVGKQARLEQPGRVWLMGISEIGFPEREQDHCHAAESAADPLIASGYERRTYRFRGTSLLQREIKKLDWAIEVNNGRVFSPGLVRSTIRRGPVLYLCLEVESERHSITWGRFKRGMEKVGLRLGANVGSREIHGHRYVRCAKELTAPKAYNPNP